MQFIEGLSDRQAADAVRDRRSWKYALGLPLTHTGFDFSVLSEFRARLIAGNTEQLLLTTMLDHLKTAGLIKARGSQRTDSTHVLSAVRSLSRLETVGETLRAMLEQIAAIAPAWLMLHITPDWFDRYSRRIEEYRLPKGTDARRSYAETIGRDGLVLILALAASTTPPEIVALPIVQTFRATWEAQYLMTDTTVKWRTAAELPVAGKRFDSPYDPEAHFGNKRTTTWNGYKVHLTETCDPDALHVITHVATTSAVTADAALPAPIHAELARRELLPDTHLVDAGYIDAELVIQSAQRYGVTLLGPVRPDCSWQAKQAHGYDISQFTIDWAQRKATCPQGTVATTWTSGQDKWRNHIIKIKFPSSVCRECSVRVACTRAKTEPRSLTVREGVEHTALQTARVQQQTAAWKANYDRRAGIEGTFSQGIRAFEVRKTRYRGQAKTHLQQIITAVAINAVRVVDWQQGKPHASTRQSRFAALKPSG